MRRVIVLGTGTDVGKTYACCSLARALADGGARVLSIKPIETGPSGADSDAARLRASSFHVKHPTRHPLYSFADPISPHRAAEAAGEAIDLGRIRDWVEGIEGRAADFTLKNQHVSDIWSLIETAGGAFSPLHAGAVNVDLAARLSPAAWVLVAPDRLGVLHDVTATLDAMRLRGRVPDHLVLSAPARPDASTGHNARDLAALGIAVPTAVVRRDRPDDIVPLARALAARRNDP